MDGPYQRYHRLNISKIYSINAVIMKKSNHSWITCGRHIAMKMMGKPIPMDHVIVVKNKSDCRYNSSNQK